MTKLPFLLNSIARSNTQKDVELTFSKLLKVLPSLEGNTVSHCLNLLSKKEINHSKFYWHRAAELLTHSHYGISDSDSASILSKYEVKDVCIILNSFAKVGFMYLDLINSCTRIINRHIRSIHTRDVCNVIHSLGKLKQTSKIKSLLNKLIKSDGIKFDLIEDIESIYNLIKNFNEQDFSMLLRVCLLNSDVLKSNKILKKIVVSLSDKYDKLSDQTIAILANSIAIYGKDDNNTLSMLTPIIISRLDKDCFTPQCMAQISNGFARIGIRDVSLLESLSRRICRCINDFPIRCIVNCLNGYSKLNYYNKELFMLSRELLLIRIGEMTPQCIGNTISAFAKFNTRMDRKLVYELFISFSRYLEKLESLDSFIPQNYANILNGLSKIRIYSPNLYYKFGNNILRCIDQLNGTDLATIFNAYSRCNIIHSLLIIRMCLQLPKIIHMMLPMEISSTFNSLGIFYTMDVSSTHVYNMDKLLFIYPRDSSIEGNNEDSHTSTDATVVKIDTNLIDKFRLDIIDTLQWLKDKITDDIINKFRPLDIRLIISSLLKSGINDDVLFTKLFNKFNDYTSFDLSIIINSYSTANIQIPSALCEMVAKHLDGMALNLKSKLNVNDYLRILSSFIKLNQMDYNIIKILSVIKDNINEDDEKLLSSVFNTVSLLYYTLEENGGPLKIQHYTSEFLIYISSNVMNLKNDNVLMGLFYIHQCNNELFKRVVGVETFDDIDETQH